mgnify:CR=1 FL=1
MSVIDDLVTVVVPVYKVEEYLNRCVESIVNQSYTKLQIILVDDGSPDSCPQMCEEWKKRDERIGVIHKQNAGLGMARNSGMDMAEGTYITFVDSDDYIALNTIEKLVALAQKNDSDVCYYGCVDVVDGEVLNIPSYSVKPGQIIGVREKSKSLEVIADALAGFNHSKYPWIEWDDNTKSGKFLHKPERADIPENIKEQLIVELYSK